MVTVSSTIQATEKDYEDLYQNRLELKNDMMKAIMCFNNEEKRQLVREWKAKYSERKVEELIRFAKHRKVCYAIAHWNLDNFRNTEK